MSAPPNILDRIVDRVLSYRKGACKRPSTPKPKTDNQESSK